MSDDAHARRSDPISSHLTVQSLGKDTSYKHLVVLGALRLEEILGTQPNGDGAWTDTQLTITIEQMTRRRHQRNVIARTRGLLEIDGWFWRVGLFDFDGRPTVHFITTPQARTAS